MELMPRTDFQLFSPIHFGILAAILGIAYGLAKVAGRYPGWSTRVRQALAGLLIVNELIWYTYRYSNEGFRFPAGLPLQLCDALVWLTAAALLTEKQWVFEAAYFLGLAGAGMALITPDLWAPLRSYPSAYFFVVHGAIVWSILFLIWAKLKWPRPGCVRRVLVFVNVYAVCVGAFNAIFGTNYMYLCRKPAGASLLDAFGPWPSYLLVGELFAFGLFVLLWLPWRKRAEGVAL